MTLTFFLEKNSNYYGVIDSGIKIRILGTQPSHLWNTTCWPCGEEFDYNTVTVLI